MFVKIEPKAGEPNPLPRAYNTLVFECDEMTLVRDTNGSNVIYATKDGKNIVARNVGDDTIFVMNTDGKTVDKLA